MQQILDIHTIPTKEIDMKKLIIAMAFIATNASTYAEVTYTPSQLNRMISNGQYPNQGSVNNSQTESMSFADCKMAVKDVMSQIKGSYPVKAIVNTGILYTVKAWTNDGVITASCSAPDKKMILTQAPYR